MSAEVCILSLLWQKLIQYVHNITTANTAADNKLRLVSLDTGTNRGWGKKEDSNANFRRSLLIQLRLVSLDTGTNRGDGGKSERKKKQCRLAVVHF